MESKVIVKEKLIENQHVIPQKFVYNMFNTQPLTRGVVHSANASLGRSFTLTDCISASGLAYKSNTHAHKHVYKHTNIRWSHPCMQSQTHTCWDVILGDSTGVYKGIFGGRSSLAGLLEIF